MASLYPYTFNGATRIRADNTDRTQQNIQSNKYSEHMMTSYFSNNKSDDYVQFGTSQPGLMFFGGATGGASKGVGAATVDTDTMLTIKRENARALEKLSLQQRPFLTVPYLGRGSCDVGLECQLRQGDVVSGKKSVSTVTEQSFINVQMTPLIDDVKSKITNPAYLIQESALDGWVRGGTATRNEVYAGNSHMPR
jgi:hypothetical protein